MKGLQKLSDITGIPIRDFQKALGIPSNVICDADTIEEARYAYRKTPFNSEARQIALEKWTRISMAQVGEIANIDDAHYVWKYAPPNSEAQQLALEKWTNLSVVQVQRAATIKEAKLAYKYTPDGSEVEWMALEKWINFFSTIEEIREEFFEDTYPENDDVGRMVLEKWISLSILEVERATTIAEAKSAYNNAPEESEAQRLALLKMVQMFETL